MKNITIFLSENFQFLVIKFALYLNRHVFVMFKINFILYYIIYLFILLHYSVYVSVSLIFRENGR